MNCRPAAMPELGDASTVGGQSAALFLMPTSGCFRSKRVCLPRSAFEASLMSHFKAINASERIFELVWTSFLRARSTTQRAERTAPRWFGLMNAPVVVISDPLLAQSPQLLSECSGANASRLNQQIVAIVPESRRRISTALSPSTPLSCSYRCWLCRARSRSWRNDVVHQRNAKGSWH